MKRTAAITLLMMFLVGVACLMARPTAEEDFSAPALTIYNQNFAVVRQGLELDLMPGINDVRFTDTTAYLEPDSVMLRDPLGRRQLRIYEQNFRNDPVSQELLLSLYEGKTIDFRVNDAKIVSGKIIRSGYARRLYDPRNLYSGQYVQSGSGNQPIIEVDGHLQFGLPGQPLFPSLTNDTILKPTLHWQLAADRPGPLQAELSYISGGLRWEADYNLVAP